MTGELSETQRDELAEAVAGIYAEWVARPATTKVLAQDDMVAIKMHGAYSAPERALIDAGHADHVAQSRTSLQLIIRSRVAEAVERCTGRPVEAVLEASHVAPDLVLQVVLVR